MDIFKKHKYDLTRFNKEIERLEKKKQSLKENSTKTTNSREDEHVGSHKELDKKKSRIPQKITTNADGKKGGKSKTSVSQGNAVITRNTDEVIVAKSWDEFEQQHGLGVASNSVTQEPEKIQIKMSDSVTADKTLLSMSRQPLLESQKISTDKVKVVTTSDIVDSGRISTETVDAHNISVTKPSESTIWIHKESSLTPAEFDGYSNRQEVSSELNDWENDNYKWDQTESKDSNYEFKLLGTEESSSNFYRIEDEVMCDEISSNDDEIQGLSTSRNRISLIVHSSDDEIQDTSASHNKVALVVQSSDDNVHSQSTLLDKSLLIVHPNNDDFQDLSMPHTESSVNLSPTILIDNDQLLKLQEKEKQIEANDKQRQHVNYSLYASSVGADPSPTVDNDIARETSKSETVVLSTSNAAQMTNEITSDLAKISAKDEINTKRSSSSSSDDELAPNKFDPSHRPRKYSVKTLNSDNSITAHKNENMEVNISNDEFQIVYIAAAASENNEDNVAEENDDKFQLDKAAAVEHSDDLTLNSSLQMTMEANGINKFWINRAEEILRSEIGQDELLKRREAQEKLFEKGAEKGTILNLPAVFFASVSLRSMFEAKIKKEGLATSSAVGALGYVIFDPSDEIPPNKFFVRNKVHEVRLSHASYPHAQDERRLGWRTLSLKFADHDSVSPLDLLLQTGEVSPLFNAEAAEQFYEALEKGPEAMKAFLISLPVYLTATIDGLRHKPDSYCSLQYHSHIVYDFHSTDSIKRVARFRVTPVDSKPDSAKLTEEDQQDAWYTILIDKEDKEGRTSKYLKDEFKKRLKSKPIEYRLEIQLRQVTTSDFNAVYNPSLFWTEERHPWLHLGTITMMSPLTDDIIELTQFNVGNLPPRTLSFPEATSIYDFNIVPNLQKEVADHLALLRAEDKIEQQATNNSHSTDYLIHLVTGSHIEAGNMDMKCNIYVSIVGTNARTKYIKLLRRTKSDFDKSQRTSFTVRDKAIGDFVCLKVYKDKKGSKSDWFLEYAVLTVPYTGRCHTLPCYRWFTDDEPVVILRDGTARLEAKEKVSYLALLRQMEVAERQRTYRWHKPKPDDDFFGFPGYIAGGDDVNNLPRELRFTLDEKKMEREWRDYMKSAGSLLRSFAKLFRSNKRKLEEEFEDVINDVDDKVKKTYTLLHIVRCWRDDKEFGRQVLNGLNPLKLIRLNDIPDTMFVTNAMVKDQLLPGRSLTQELQAGKIFYISYSELSHYVNAPFAEEEDKGNKEQPVQRFLCAPQVLLYSKNGVLLPIAIQLTSSKDDVGETITYTPEDDHGTVSDWLLAKTWVKVSDANVHQFGEHVCSHLILEAVAIAIMRNLPSVHPLYKLLSPHLRDVILANTIYRKLLLRKNGTLAEVMGLGVRGSHLTYISKTFEHFRYKNWNVADHFRKLGTDSKDILPEYYFRDDALQLWQAIKDCIGEILAIYYRTTADIDKDDELKATMDDLTKNGFRGNGGWPQKFDDVDELAVFVTSIIFQCTVYNAATMSGQFDYYGFVPNAPPCMMEPYPKSKNPQGWTDSELKAMLPSADINEKYVGLSMILSKPSQSSDTLGYSSEHLFTEEAVHAAIRKFQKTLKNISADIKQRNDTIECPYEYLLPGKIPAKLDI